MERITPRYVFEARIRIRVQRASQNLAMEGWARDISETGISAFVAQGLAATLNRLLGPFCFDGTFARLSTVSICILSWG